MIQRLLQSLGRRTRPATNVAEGDRYRSALPALTSRDQRARQTLAADGRTEGEVLYYLAGDSAAEVRRLVAANPATPIQADRLLSGDMDDEVRAALAQKIARLVPTLDPDGQTRLYERAVEVLERLAQDNLPRVRRIVAEEIKTSLNVPRSLVRKLAKDVELIVSAPVLEYSPLLEDDDLIEIIAAGTAEGALSAIARRRQLSARVTDAVVATMDVPAVAALLSNTGAEIRTETLDHIADQAELMGQWHGPLAVRSDLSLRAVRRIAGFVASSLVEELTRRHGLDAETAETLARRVRERLRNTSFEEKSAADAAAEIQSALVSGKLDDATVTEAAQAGRIDFVTHALARLAQVPPGVVSNVLTSRSGKAVTALVWKAGLGMRVSVKIQQHVALVPPSRIVHARDGLHFPLGAEEMALHLSLFGIPA